MNSIFGNLGIAGLAACLTALLILGTKPGGRLKQLGWTPCLVLGMLAGSAYGAAGGIFAIIPQLTDQAVGLIKSVSPGIGMGAIALLLVIVIGFKKLSTRQVAVLGITFWYVASQSGGIWSTVANAIATAGHGFS